MTEPNDLSGAGTPPAGVAPTARTVESVEAEYRARISGKDTAHNEELTALRNTHAAALAAAQQDSQAKLTEALGKVTEFDQIKAERDALKTSLADEQRGRALDVRKARFPKAAESLGDDVTATMDEARLTALEAQLGSGATTQQPVGTSPVLPNTATRTPPSGAKPVGDMNSDELKSLMQQQESDFIASIRG